MLNKQFIKERLILISSFVKELEDLSNLDMDTFKKDKKISAAGESFLRRSLEAIFDIGRHILAKSGYTDLSMEYKSIAKGLVEVGVVDKDLGEKLVQMAGYRNRLVHMYNLITEEELYEIIKNDLKDIKEFISAVKRYLEKV